MNNVSDKVKKDRKDYNQLGEIYPENQSVTVTFENVSDVPCYWFTPEQPIKGTMIIYLHGGMFGLGSIKSYRPMISHLACTLQTTILYVEYSLAPEKPFPTALNETLIVYRDVIQNHAGTKITIIGDSAGGGLSVSLLEKLSSANIKPPVGLILMSPWIYLQCDTQSHTSRKQLDPIIKTDMLREYAAYYAGNDLALADPGQIRFNEFPQLLILVGTNEVLYDDSELFYARVRAVQPNAQIKTFPGQTHVFPMTDIHSESTRKAFDDMRKFFDQVSNHSTG